MALEGYIYDGEVPSSTTISDMLINVVVGAEIHDLDAGAEAMVAGLVEAWSGAKEHENEDEDDFDLDHVRGPEAEKVWGDNFRAVYCRRLHNRAPNENDEVGWWPDCLNYNSSFPRKLLRKVARVMGAIEADRSRAMYRYMQERTAEASNA